jgi:hypothetical protein
MLINQNKTYSPGDVMTLRLITGEEILAKYHSDSETAYTVSRPMALMPGPQGVVMAQLAMTLELDDEVQIQKAHVVVHGLTRDIARDSYIQATTGIKTVRGNLLNATGMPGR